MKYKEIAIEITNDEAVAQKSAGKTVYAWIRPNAKFKSAMNLLGGFDQIPDPFTLTGFNSVKSGSPNYVNLTDLPEGNDGQRSFTWIAAANLSFFKISPRNFNADFFEVTDFTKIYLRKYTTPQKLWADKIIKKFFKGKHVVIGEYYPAYAVPDVSHIYLSDTYCYFKANNKIIELDPTKKVTAKMFKEPKKDKVSKADIIKALDHVSDIICEREVTDKKYKHTQAQGRWKARIPDIKVYAEEFKKARHAEVAFAKAEQAAKDILTPEEMKHIKEVHGQRSRNAREYKTQLDKYVFEYKRDLRTAKAPVPTKGDYKLDDKQMNKEFDKINKFLADGTIERFDYDPAKGIIITFPPMEYKSFRGSARYFLGRPRVVIHDPSVCTRGKASCGIIRFTLPSYPMGMGSTDHFNNQNGDDMMKCAGVGTRDGQCLGSTSEESFLNLFMPLISSRRFGELIPHLKNYILESNKNSPLTNPQDHMIFSGIEPGKRHPTNLIDDSWTEFCKLELKKQIAKETKVEVAF